MVNSTAEARRHAAAAKIGSVYELEYAAKSWFGLPAAKSPSDIHEKRAFPERDQSLQNSVSLGEIQTAHHQREADVNDWCGTSAIDVIHFFGSQ